MSNLRHILLLSFFMMSANLFGLSASTAKITVNRPVHVGWIRMPAGMYTLVWANDRHDLDLLISVDGRHWAVPATVEPDPKPGKERVLIRDDRDGAALLGFRIQGLLILIHPDRLR